jgi:molybdopterin-guanine dinucleotide biosynthesis protein B
MIKSPIPLLGFAAVSGTGKTTLLCKLIPLLKAQGIRISVVKHSHHDFDIDHAGKDSYRLRESGASNIVIASRKRTAIIIEHPQNQQDDPSLENALKHIHSDGCDLILVEGFKRADFPKIELHRHALDSPYLYPTDSNIIAIALDHELKNANKGSDKTPVQLDLDQPQKIVDFIVEKILKKTSRS